MDFSLHNLLYQLRTRCQRYRPSIPDCTDTTALIRQTADFFGLPVDQAQTDFEFYSDFSLRQNYASRLGERKTLCMEEAFILYSILKQHRPPTLIEIGTEYGRSARRLIDIKTTLALNSSITCYEISDRVRFFQPGEATLILKNVAASFQHDILDAYPPGVIYLDAHPHALLHAVITGVLASQKPWILAIHDCAKGLCNPRMFLSKDDPRITSWTGVWERHVLADIFNITDPLSKAVDHVETERHRFHVFPTPHGLGVLMPRFT